MPNKYDQVLLISDFGYKDPYLGYLKASIYDNNPKTTLVDITHDLSLGDISTAAYFMRAMLVDNWKPKIILCAVNNHYTTNPKFIIFEYNKHLFIGPDNGVFSLLIDDLIGINVYQLDDTKVVSTDVAAVYSHLISCAIHGLSFEDYTVPCENPTKKVSFRPVITNNTIRATIIHVDSFGNVIINVEKDQFDKARKGRLFHIYYNPHDPIYKISRSYADVPVGEVVAFFNDSGLLELAINQANAATLLNLNKNETIQIDFYE